MICSSITILFTVSFIFTINVILINGAILDLHIYYPEHNVNKVVLSRDQDQSLFWLWIYTCEENHINSNGYYTFGSNVCPGGEINRNVPQSPSDPLYFPNYTISNIYDRAGLNRMIIYI